MINDYLSMKLIHEQRVDQSLRRLRYFGSYSREQRTPPSWLRSLRTRLLAGSRLLLASRERVLDSGSGEIAYSARIRLSMAQNPYFGGEYSVPTTVITRLSGRK